MKWTWLWLVALGCEGEAGQPLVAPTNPTTTSGGTVDPVDTGAYSTVDPCLDVYDDTYEACIAAGGVAVDCVTQADQAESTCYENAPGGACRAQADEVFDTCMASGGDPTDCRLRAESVFNNCMD